MLDWLRYFPIKLWNDDQYEGLAKGPYFSKLKPTSVNMGDCLLKLKMPRTNKVWQPFDVFKCEPKNYSPYDTDILNEPLYGNHSAYVGVHEKFHGYEFLTRNWYFVSPWFGGKQIKLVLHGRIVSVNKDKTLGDLNLFHPRSFEFALAEYLDSMYGARKEGRKAALKAPLNWKVKKLGGLVEAAIFDVEHIFSTDEIEDIARYVMFPVSKTQFVSIMLKNYGGYSPTSERKNTSEMIKLVKRIIDSIELKLGSQTRAEIEKIKQTCPDMSLTKEFGILKWPIKPEDVGKAAPLSADVPLPLAKN